MKYLSWFIIGSLVIFDILLLGWILLHGQTIAIVNPRGVIALQERNILVTAIFLGLSVVLPVILLTFLIAWKYRANNTKAIYTPEWSGNTLLKCIWWAIPSVVVVVLAVIAWKGAHTLDPYKPIESSTQPLTIQVVALNWKWLFIYPEQHIASVNFVEFPENTPISFELTADAPMNSFWIPQLGGQMFAMAGMQTQLHLIADAPGDFAGSEVEINGPGFAGMRFTARATTQKDFDAWVQSVQKSSHPLTNKAYDNLTKPSEYNPPSFYAPVEKNLYNAIMMKFMTPPSPSSSQMQMNDTKQSGSMHGMEMK